MWTILVAFFQLLIVGWETATSVLKTENTNILSDGKRRILWHSVKNLVNLIRSINKH
jgi:hypothetical protein